MGVDGAKEGMMRTAVRYVRRVESPLGTIVMGSDGEAIVGLWFEGQKHFDPECAGGAEEAELPVFAAAEKWLGEYFDGKDPGDPPPAAPCGTKFQIAVWDVLRTIPYGKTVTYGDIAKLLSEKLQRRTSARAVGNAVGRNPVGIMIPCHRVVGADGALTGYAGGIERKARLLALEAGAAAERG